MTTELDLGWIDPRLRGITRQEPGPGSGLCRAVGTRLGIDPVLVRVIVALLALSGGLGVALYLWGTALTAGPTGVRPIDSILPTFSGWGRRAQQAAVVVSSIALVVAVSSITPLPWFPGVLLIVILILARRRIAGGPVGARQWAPPAAPDRPASAAESDDALIARWRATMGAAAGPARLPVVDLYGPPEPAPLPAAPRPRTAWLAGTVLVAASTAGGVGASLLLGDPVLGLGAGLILAGLLTVVHALVTRQRRMPRPVLVATVAGAAVAGFLAAQTAGPASAEFSAPGSVMTIDAAAESRTVDLSDTDFAGVDRLTIDSTLSEVTVDLTEADLGDVSEIRVDASLSEVILILPGAPSELTTGATHLSEVTVSPSFPEDAAAFDVPIVVDSIMSTVSLED